MGRRHLVAMAALGALSAGITTFAVAAAPLVQASTQTSADRPRPAVTASISPRMARPIPLIIGHRGSAYRPEHTLESYRVAIDMGADYIEPDLVMTQDRILVARHENELSATTNVAKHPEFAGRKKTKIINGAPITGWFSEDFTLAELRTLRAVERNPRRTGSAAYNGKFAIPTLQEIVDLTQAESRRLHRPIGLYLELKVPGYFTSIGLAPEPRLAELLQHDDLAADSSPIFVESFDPDSLRRLHALVGVPLIQLLWGDGQQETPDELTATLVEARGYAVGIGIDRARLCRLIVTPQAGSGASCRGSGSTMDARAPAISAAPITSGPAAAVSAANGAEPSPTAPIANIVLAAHQHGLEVHVFTFASESVYHPLPPSAYRAGDPSTAANTLAEYRIAFGLGVDAVFTDNPDLALRARSSRGATAAPMPSSPSPRSPSPAARSPRSQTR